MSTNKKFRIQNGVDVKGELTVNDVVIIRADGTIVAGAIADAVASLVDAGALTGSGSSIIDSDSQIFIDVNNNTLAIASETATRISDIANLQTQIDSLGVNADTQAEVDSLQSQIDSIVGASPETLDTLVEIVSAFEGADSDIQALLAANSSSLSANTAAIGVETTQRIAGDVTLQQNIDAEVVRATAAEQANAAAIAAEAATRGAAVSALQASQFTYNDSDGWTGNLIPSADNQYALGSPDRVWKDLYIGPGSLYINGTKILEDNSGTITMYADAGQNLSFGATGGGTIDLNAGDESVQLKSDLVMSVGETISTVGGAPTKFGGDVDMGTHQVTNVGTPVDPSDAATKEYVDGLNAEGTISGDKVFEDNVTIQGNLSVEGTTTTLDTQTLTVADNIIDLNSNVTTGIPTLNAGIRIMRGDEPAVQLRWNELEDRWEVYDGVTATAIAVESTDDMAEGSSNLYFTVVRAREAVSQDIADAVAAEAASRGAAIDAEIARATSAETQLAADIAAEATARASADSDETAARISADATLQANIDAEAAARIASDLNEVQARQAAIDDLQAQLNSVTGSDLSSIQSQIDAIVGSSPETLDTIQEVVAAFEGADSDLTSLITGNSSTITAVNASLTQEVADRTFAVAAEATARENADDALQASIDAEVARATAAEVGNANAIAAETAARIASDSDLNASRIAGLEAEETARVAGDATVQAAVDAEVARATAAEQANASAISAETTRALAAEADLQNKIDQVEAGGAAHPLFSTLADLPDASANHGMFAHVHAEGAAYFAHAGQWVKLANFSDLDGIDLSSIQSQIDAIVGSSPETLDTLQEIVAAFESADGDLQALITANSSLLGASVTTTPTAADFTITGTQNNTLIEAYNGMSITNNGNPNYTYRNLPTYLDGLLATQDLNSTNGSTWTLPSCTVYMIRGESWRAVPLDGWTLVEEDVDYVAVNGDASQFTNLKVYTKDFAAGDYTFDNDSGLYFFEPQSVTTTESLDTTATTLVGAVNELHAEMADNSAVTSALQTETDARVAAISAEETARIAGDADNASAIVDEANARAAADTAETQARISADNALQASIDAEVAARQSALTSQAALITTTDQAQTAARNADVATLEAADSDLQSQITTLQEAEAARVATGATSDEVVAVQDALDAEVVRAQLAEQANASAIITGDAALQAQLDAIIGTSPETLDTLQEIVSAYTSADNDLQYLVQTNAAQLDQIQSVVGDAGVPLITPDEPETVTYTVEYSGRQYYAVTENNVVYFYDSEDTTGHKAAIDFGGTLVNELDMNSHYLGVRYGTEYLGFYRVSDLVTGYVNRLYQHRIYSMKSFAMNDEGDYGRIYIYETHSTNSINSYNISSSGGLSHFQGYTVNDILGGTNNSLKMSSDNTKLYAFDHNGSNHLDVFSIGSTGHVTHINTLTSEDFESDSISWGVQGGASSFGAYDASSTIIAVGAPGDDTQGTNVGAVYVYNPDNLEQSEVKVYPPAAYVEESMNFGQSVAVTDTRLIVAAPQAVGAKGRLFVYDAINLDLPPLIIESPDTDSGFGAELLERSNRLYVNVRADDDRTYVYDLTELDALPFLLDKPVSSSFNDGGEFGRLAAIGPANQVSQSFTETIVPAAGVANSINYLESKRQELRADLEANLAAILANDADIASIAADVATNTANIATNAAAIVAVDADRTAFEASVNADRQSHRDAVQADIDQVNADRTAFETSVNQSQAAFIADHDSDYTAFVASVDGTFAETNQLQTEIRTRMGTGHIALPQELTSITYTRDVGNQYYVVQKGDDEMFVYSSADWLETNVNVGIGTRLTFPAGYSTTTDVFIVDRNHAIFVVDNDFLVYDLSTISVSSTPIVTVSADGYGADERSINYKGGDKFLIAKYESSAQDNGGVRIYDIPSLVAGNAVYIETNSSDLPVGADHPTGATSTGYAYTVDWNDTHVFVGNSSLRRIYVYDRTDLSYVDTLLDSTYGDHDFGNSVVASNTMVATFSDRGGYHWSDGHMRMAVFDASDLTKVPHYFTDNEMVRASGQHHHNGNTYFGYHARNSLTINDDYLAVSSNHHVMIVRKDKALGESPMTLYGHIYEQNFNSVQAQIKDDRDFGVYAFHPSTFGGYNSQGDARYPWEIKIIGDFLTINTRRTQLHGYSSDHTGTLFIHDLNNLTTTAAGTTDLAQPVKIEEINNGNGDSGRFTAISPLGTITETVTETFNPNDDLTAAVNYLNAKKEELKDVVEAVAGSSTIVQDLQAVEANIDFKLLAQDQRFDSDKAEQIAIYAAANAEQAAIYDSANAAHVAYFEQYTIGETAARQSVDSDLRTDVDLVTSRVDAIVGTSPETLDTLQEIVTYFENADSTLQGVVTSNETKVNSLLASLDFIGPDTSVTFSDVEPTSGNEGDAWFDKSTGKVYEGVMAPTTIGFAELQTTKTVPDGYDIGEVDGITFNDQWINWNNNPPQAHYKGSNRVLNTSFTLREPMYVTYIPAGSEFSLNVSVVYFSDGTQLSRGNSAGAWSRPSDETRLVTGWDWYAHSYWQGNWGTLDGNLTASIFDWQEVGYEMESHALLAVAGDDNLRDELMVNITALENYTEIAGTLETSSQTLTGAINELNTSVQSITGSDTQFLDDIATNQTNIAGHDSDFVDVRGRLDVIEGTSVPNLQSQIDVHSGQIATEVADRTAGDAALQAQIDNIVGTSPETLDTLQEVVSTFQNADNDLQTLITGNTAIVSQHTDQIATLDSQINTSTGANLTVPNMPTQVKRYVYQDQYMAAISGRDVLVWDANNPTTDPTVITVGTDNERLSALSIVRDKLIVGGRNDDDPFSNNEEGAVYVYDLNDLSADPHILLPTNTYGDQQFGVSVTGSAEHSYIIVGAWGEDSSPGFGPDAGEVSIFDMNNLDAPRISLVPDRDKFMAIINSMPGTHNYMDHHYFNFGHSVRVDGDYLYVSASGWQYEVVVVYDLRDLTADPVILWDSVLGMQHRNWQDMEGLQYTTMFGYSMAFNSTKVAIGAYDLYGDDTWDADQEGRGGVYVYDKDVDGRINYNPAENIAGEATATASDYASNSYLPQYAADEHVGTAWSSSQGVGSWIQYNWSEEKTIDTLGWYPYDNAHTVEFTFSDGSSFTLSGMENNRMTSHYFESKTVTWVRATIVGGNGNAGSRNFRIVESDHIHLYELPDMGNQSSVDFGRSVAMDETYLYVGAPYTDRNTGNDVGSVYVFDLATKELVHELNAYDASAGDQFGRAISVNGGKLAVAAPWDDDGSEQSGSIYFYDTSNLTGIPVKISEAFQSIDTDYLGLTTGDPRGDAIALTVAAGAVEINETIIPNASLSSGINYLESKTTQMELQIQGLNNSGAVQAATNSNRLDSLETLTAQTALDVVSGDSDLQAQIDALTITANGDVSAEALLRIAADDAEEAARIAADATLQSNIDTVSADVTAETTRATAAEAGLQSQLDAIVGTSPETLDTLQEVVAAFEGADGDLQTLITTNTSEIATLNAFVDGVSTLETTAQTVTTAINELHSELDAEVLRAQTAEGAEEVRALAAEAVLQSNINTESSARLAGDAGLQSQIDTLSGTQTSDKSSLEVSIANETARATAAENTLQSNIDAESTRAQTAEAANAAAVVTEQTRAEAVEAGLAADIAVETARATAAEAQLANHLGANFTDGSITIDGLATFNGGLYFGDGTGTIGFNASVDHIQSLSDLDMMSNSVINVAAPVDSADAANKAYVDATTQVVSDRVDAILNGAGESLDTIVEVVAAFENADSDIQALITSNSASVTANTNAINAEVAARQQAITDEATARANADSDLSAGLSNETSRALAAEGVLTSDLAAEVARATSAETGLASDIAAETSRATAAEGVNATAISAETTRATTVEASLAQDIADEALRAQGAEAVLTSDVSANATAISNLQSQVAGVSTSSGSSNIEMTAEVDMSGNKITGMADPTAAQDAATKSYVDATVATEATARTTEDSSLQSNIDAANARIDAILNGSVESLDTVVEVVSAFEGADSDIQNLITANASTISQNAAAIAAETTARANADSDESALRAAADAVLTADLAATNVRTAGIDASSGTIEVSSNVDMNDNNITGVNDVYAARGFIDTIESGSLTVQTGTVSFEGSTVNFGSATLIGNGFGNATKQEIDQHLNQSAAGTNEFLKWNGTDYEFTDYIQGQLATNMITVEGTLKTEQPGSTIDWQDGLVHFGGSQVIVDEPTSPSLAANKRYVDEADSDLNASLSTAIANEESRATTAEGVLTTNLTNEISRATSAEAALASDISAEETRALAAEAAEAGARADADSDLQSAIDAEVARATAAEAVNAQAVVDEATARATADTTLQSNIDTVSGRVDAILNGSSESLDTIVEVVAAFENADSDLQTLISSNAGSHTANAAAITAEETRATNAEAALQSAIDAEETRATGVETDLQSQITSEIASRSAADQSMKDDLDSDIAAEAALRSAGDATLQSAIDVEVARATAAEGVLQSLLDSEQSARILSDQGLQSAITAEENARVAADAVLQSAIDAEELARTSADNTLQANIDAVDAAVTAITNGSPETLNQLVEVVAAFEDADSDLQTLITNLGGDASALTARVATLEGEMDATELATTSNANAISAETAARVAAVQVNADAITAESTARAAAITAEQNARAAAIAASESDRDSADADLQAQITALATTEQTSKSSLQALLNQEVADRTAGDSDLTDSLAAEVARATAAESALSSDISDESSARATADASLQTQINNILSNTDATALNSLAEIVAEFQSVDGTLTGLINSNGSRITALESSVGTIEAWNTDNVSEGTTNLYFTDARAKACLTGGLCIDYDSTTGEIAIDEVEAASSLTVAESHDANALGGEAPSYYRINVYDAAGNLVN